MNQTTKTLTMLGVAALLAAVAYATRPHLPYADTGDEVGQPMFPDWKDPAAAKSISITTFDEAIGALHTPFTVADVKGRWVIPSHDNYPANAEQTVNNLASKLINLTIVGVVSNERGDQETYGVVEPDANKLSAGASGIGKLIVVKDDADKDLCRLIIGREDKSRSENGPGDLRFVRRAGQDRIYRVALNTDQFTTKFADWIDTDLLGLKQHWDIDELKLREYSLDNSTLDHKWDLDLDFDQQKNAWNVKQLTNYKDNQPASGKLAPDEELDSNKINDLKMNVSGLKIVGVDRKPAAFIARLKEGKSYLDDGEAQQSLAEHEFYAFPERNPTDLLARGGDMTIGMKDGVEYSIHFGKSTVTFGQNDGKDKKAKAAGKDEKSSDVERVVFVTARFNPDLIPKPVLEPLPAAKKPEPAKPDATKPEATKPAGKEPAATTPVQPKPADKQPEKTSPDKAAPKSSANGKPELLLALADEKAAAAPKTGAGPPAADTKPAEPNTAEPKTAPKPAAKKPDDKKPDAKQPDADGKPPAEATKSDIQRAQEEQERDAERKQIEMANKQKQDQYDETVKNGKNHAKELNNRFADWYYVISEDDYKKVHVTRGDIIKKKAGEAGPNPGPVDPFKVPGRLPGAGQ